MMKKIYFIFVCGYLAFSTPQAMEVLNIKEEIVSQKSLETQSLTRQNGRLVPTHHISEIQNDFQDADVFNGITEIWSEIMRNMGLSDLYHLSQCSHEMYSAFSNLFELKLPRTVIRLASALRNEHWLTLKMIKMRIPPYSYQVDSMLAGIKCFWKNEIHNEIKNEYEDIEEFIQRDPERLSQQALKAVDRQLDICGNYGWLYCTKNPYPKWIRPYANPWRFAGFTICSVILFGISWYFLPGHYTQDAIENCMDPAQFDDQARWASCLFFSNSHFESRFGHCDPFRNYLIINRVIDPEYQVYSLNSYVAFSRNFSLYDLSAHNLLSYLNNTFHLDYTKGLRFLSTPTNHCLSNIDSLTKTSFVFTKDYYPMHKVERMTLDYFNPQCVYDATRDWVIKGGMIWGIILFVARLCFWVFVYFWY